MVAIAVPLWVLIAGAAYLIVNALAYALDPRTFWGKFVKALALNMPAFMETEMHVKLPALPTQAGQDSVPPATSTQS